jgi:hypothetical protein
VRTPLTIARPFRRFSLRAEFVARRWLWLVRRHFWPTFAGIVASLLVTDLVGHVYYRLRHGAFLWADENAVHIFQIWPNVRVVDDERFVVPKENYSSEWIETDANGFRIGSNSYEGKSRVVVFIGDSVPFGWGTTGPESVPSHFARLLQENGKSEIGVINAAVPSYSLRQAVKHYELDVDGRFPVSAVVLQIWDPAQQLARHGRAWTPDMNWTTRNAKASLVERKLLAHEAWIRRSSLIYYASLAYLSPPPTRLRPDDAETKARLFADNHRTLDELGARVQARGIPLYLLPGNPQHGLSAGEGPHATALRWVNESLRLFAARAQRTHFIDVIRRFDEVGRDGLFIDDCHLTDAGAAIEAKAIYESMVRNGDLQ